jgi:hypothetical protein
MTGHDFRVAVLLTADEFCAMTGAAESEGLSQSAYIRRLLKAAIQARAASLVSNMQEDSDTTKPVQLRSVL